MIDDLAEIKADVKEIKSSVAGIQLQVERNTVSLDHHIKRTDLNEDRIKTMEQWTLGLLAAITLAILGKTFF